jgi:hypothetical protein
MSRSAHSGHGRANREWRTLRRRHIRKLLTVSAALTVIVACTASAGATVGRSSDQPSCTGGASSITATYENAQVVESTPQISGCASFP